LAVDFTAYTVARHPEFNSGLFALLDIGDEVTALICLLIGF